MLAGGQQLPDRARLLERNPSLLMRLRKHPGDDRVPDSVSVVQQLVRQVFRRFHPPDCLAGECLVEGDLKAIQVVSCGLLLDQRILGDVGEQAKQVQPVGVGHVPAERVVKPSDDLRKVFGPRQVRRSGAVAGEGGIEHHRLPRQSYCLLAAGDQPKVSQLDVQVDRRTGLARRQPKG